MSASSVSSALSSYLRSTNPISPVRITKNLHSAEILTSTKGNYVPAACWTAAEPSIAVVSACLPSLRPLFVRLIWRNTHRPKLSSSKHLTSWRSNKKQSRTGSTQGSFNRLNEFSTSLDDSGGTGLWNSNTVKVFGGTKPKRGSGGKGKREEVELEDHGSEAEVPLGRIRAKTEVVLTISDRVDWRDDLF